MSTPSSRADAQRANRESAGTDAPLVSVVVPTYGRSPELFAAAIESIQAQTYENIELVVVDDSPEEVSRWVADLDDFVRVERVCDGNHEGAAAARNSGIWRADGAYLAFLDDDDRWAHVPTALQVATLQQHGPAVGVVYTALQYVENGRVVRRGSARTAGDVTKDILTGASLGTFSTLMVREAAIPRVGFVDPQLPILEDREWCLRLSQKYRFVAIDRPLVRYRKGGREHLTDDYDALREQAVPRFERKHRDLAASYGPDCERAFRSSLQKTCALSALSSGRYPEARRHSLWALRHQPGDRRAWAYLMAAIGGPYTYKPLRLGRRLAHRFTNATRAGDPNRLVYTD